MIGENPQLVTNEPVEFEKLPVKVQDCRKCTDRCREFIEYTPQFNEGKPEDVNM